ncbi:hypothetical protein ACKUT9_22505 [Mycobacterium seoulense]|uniref:hypothetical protein n=1 Tax=Mycobacterium seoulense TaxID=386911 RepID=UPI003CEBCDA0
MTGHRFVVLSNPIEGKDDAFNKWYDEVHVPEVLDVPGVVAIKVEDQQTRYLQRGLNGRQYVFAGRRLRIEATPLSQKCARERGKHTAAELGYGEEEIISSKVESVVL